MCILCIVCVLQSDVEHPVTFWVMTKTWVTHHLDEIGEHLDSASIDKLMIYRHLIHENHFQGKQGGECYLLG